MKQDLDKILDLIITTLDMLTAVFKGGKKLRKLFKKKKIIVKPI